MSRTIRFGYEANKLLNDLSHNTVKYTRPIEYFRHFNNIRYIVEGCRKNRRASFRAVSTKELAIHAMKEKR